MRSYGHKQTQISVVETIGGHERCSPDEVPEFLSMPRWRPWELEIRDGHKQTEISVVETIGGHGRWRPEFLSKLTINN
jgi:hypothetical protein